MSTPASEILQAFIADETAAFSAGERGAYYPSQHHRIKPLVARADNCLTEPDRIALYFHLLRLDDCPVLKDPAEFALLRQAYTQVQALFASGYPVCSLCRPKGLFLFGADDRGPLADVLPTDHAAYLRHASFWQFADGFSHMPGMLKKRPRFAELSADAALTNRVLQVLLRVHPGEDLTTPTTLWFWSLLLLVIQQPDAGRVAVHRLIREDCPWPDRRPFLKNLLRYLQASGRQDLLAEIPHDPELAAED